METKRRQDAAWSIFTARALGEGKVPILFLFLLCLAGMAVAWWLGTLFLLPLIFTVAFFRDPARPGADDPAAILAPADGTVVEIDRVLEEQFLGGQSTRVAIFLSVFDVHVQRMPVAGVIRLVHYQPGGHLDARDERATRVNESRLVGIESDDGYRLAVRQIAGKVARRIVGWAEGGQTLAQGERLGMIRFGSRVETYLPAETKVLVSIGAHVRGGKTILARRR